MEKDTVIHDRRKYKVRVIHLIILDILKKYTDKEHPISGKEIIKHLSTDECFKDKSIDPKTVSQALLDLQEYCGYDVICCTESPNDEIKPYRTSWYFNGGINQTDINKMFNAMVYGGTGLLNPDEAVRLTNIISEIASPVYQVHHLDLPKPEQIIQRDIKITRSMRNNMEMIMDAILYNYRNKKENKYKIIEFNFREYTINKNKIVLGPEDMTNYASQYKEMRNNQIIPYKVIERNYCYYVIGVSTNKTVGYYRIDKMTSLKATEVTLENLFDNKEDIKEYKENEKAIVSKDSVIDYVESHYIDEHKGRPQGGIRGFILNQKGIIDYVIKVSKFDLDTFVSVFRDNYKIVSSTESYVTVKVKKQHPEMLEIMSVHCDEFQLLEPEEEKQDIYKELIQRFKKCENVLKGGETESNNRRVIKFKVRK